MTDIVKHRFPGTVKRHSSFETFFRKIQMYRLGQRKFTYVHGYWVKSWFRLLTAIKAIQYIHIFFLREHSNKYTCNMCLPYWGWLIEDMRGKSSPLTILPGFETWSRISYIYKNYNNNDTGYSNLHSFIHIHDTYSNINSYILTYTYI